MRTPAVALAALVAFTATLAASASAEEGWRSLAEAPGGGSFTFAGGDEERRQVAVAVERAIAEMSFLLRPFARSRLAAGNRVFERLSIRRDGADLVVDRDGSVVRSPADGSPAAWAAPDGKEYVVRQALGPSGLTQHFTAEDGERLNTLTLSPDGLRLRLAVEVRSARLPSPLAYALEYARERP